MDVELITVQNLSAFPRTVYSNKIKENMVLVGYEMSNRITCAFTGAVSFANGVLTLNGSIKGTTDLVLYCKSASSTN